MKDITLPPNCKNKKRILLEFSIFSAEQVYHIVEGNKYQSTAERAINEAKKILAILDNPPQDVESIIDHAEQVEFETRENAWLAWIGRNDSNRNEEEEKEKAWAIRDAALAVRAAHHLLNNDIKEALLNCRLKDNYGEDREKNCMIKLNELINRYG